MVTIYIWAVFTVKTVIFELILFIDSMVIFTENRFLKTNRAPPHIREERPYTAVHCLALLRYTIQTHWWTRLHLTFPTSLFLSIYVACSVFYNLLSTLDLDDFGCFWTKKILFFKNNVRSDKFDSELQILLVN